MLIKDILEGGGGAPVLSVPSSMPLLEAAGKLQSSNSGAVVVLQGEALVGVFSERALVNAVATRGSSIALMSVADVIEWQLVTCTLDDDVTEILDRMGNAGVHHVPVVEDGRAITILTVREFETACHYLKAQAETDELTGLANRRSLMPEVDRLLARFHKGREPVAVAMLDVDLLKRVNDKLGHAAGDALLRLVARAIARETRSFDTVARIGGDEFAIVFPQTRLHDAVQACRRILGACSRIPLPRVDGVYQITLSIGVTIAQNGDTADAILQRADHGLYEAKACGRGRVIAIRTSVLDQMPRLVSDNTQARSEVPAVSDDQWDPDQARAVSSSI